MKIKTIPKITDEKKTLFWDKVDIRGPDDCWEWTAFRNPKGYGMFKVRPGDGYLAHRISYFLEHGHNPGAYCLHSCDNPPCCNPKHTFSGTQQDNMDDMRSKGRENYSKRQTRFKK